MAIRISKNRIVLEEMPLNEAKGTAVASAASPNIWTVTGNTIHITGTTNITSFPSAPQAGVWRHLVFDGAVLLSYGSDFIIAGGNDYTTLADDIVDVYADTTTKFYLFPRKKFKRISTITSSATPTPNANSTDVFTVTALAAGATFAAPTGTPAEGQMLIIRIKDNATARTLAWNAIYRASSDLALPTTTIISKTLYLGFIYNFTDTKWDLLALLNNF